MSCPEEEELTALYDRFLVRFVVGYIAEDFRFLRMLESQKPAGANHAHALRNSPSFNPKSGKSPFRPMSTAASPISGAS